ncbi:hypothetical protein RR46_08936 [Papilio xuthus]|uniref:Uncharacterized protein n=1 Tax=Papilio xuthus TaxID=66420 RepID=A0A194PQ86_PAPXU|nr:hypothetical protein RR46_08936 [Papilio xuthus]
MRPPSEYEGARMPAEAEEGDPRAPAMMICARLAGRAIIRVVGRCEDAQENSQLVDDNCKFVAVNVSRNTWPLAE